MLLGQKKKCHVWNRQLLQLSWGLSFPRSSSPARTYPAGDQGDYKIRRKWVISRLKTPKLIHKHLVHEELVCLFNYTWCGGTSPPLSPAHLFHIGMGTAAQPRCAPRPQHLEAQEGCPWLELHHGLAADKAPAPSTLRCSHCHGKQTPPTKSTCWQRVVGGPATRQRAIVGQGWGALQKAWGALQMAQGALQMAQGALQITHFLFLVSGPLT